MFPIVNLGEFNMIILMIHNKIGILFLNKCRIGMSVEARYGINTDFIFLFTLHSPNSTRKKLAFHP